MNTPTALRERFMAELANVSSSSDLERLRIAYLGRKGALAELFDRIRDLPPGQRRDFGRTLNELKEFISREITARQSTLEHSRPTPTEDLTLPGRRDRRGGLHPLTALLEEIVEVFRGMGFRVETGPEAETVRYNFDALNTPIWHPARDLTDTFYLDIPPAGGSTAGVESDYYRFTDPRAWLLRTETSPVQIRVMERQRPPIRIIAPGRVYRNDKPDATHSPIFMQVEGLYVDEGVTFADLKGTVLAFYRAMFGPEVKTRFRPHFFPFTEPSAEVDMTCIFCSGSGCRTCKHSGWLEMGGSGMVDPNVLSGVGIDPEVYSGWAFGLGVERIAMLKWGIDDIRLFYENDLRVLEQLT